MSRSSPHRISGMIAGRYRLISPLGEGGFGATYRAWDNESGVPVVLKMPLAKLTGRPLILERFEREVVRLRQCSHPHIVPILDDGQDDQGRPFLVMRFLPGGSLADRPKPVSPAVLHRWLPAIASAIDYIHSQGVLHRDIKPANIFFDTQARAFLGDFGIAKLVDEQVEDGNPPVESLSESDRKDNDREDSLTRTGSLIGTYVYMAPELFADRPRLTPQADQYSLAISVYEMLSGTLPVLGTEEMLRQFHREGTAVPLSKRLKGLPYSLSYAVDKALRKTPEQRFGSCNEFVAAVLSGVPFTPVDPSHYRFLCPGCHRIVRVPEDFGGRACRCPDCGIALRVSKELNALWRSDEDPSHSKQDPEVSLSWGDQLAWLSTDRTLELRRHRKQRKALLARYQIMAMFRLLLIWLMGAIGGGIAAAIQGAGITNVFGIVISAILGLCVTAFLGLCFIPICPSASRERLWSVVYSVAIGGQLWDLEVINVAASVVATVTHTIVSATLPLPNLQLPNLPQRKEPIWSYILPETVGGWALTITVCPFILISAVLAWQVIFTIGAVIVINTFLAPRLRSLFQKPLREPEMKPSTTTQSQ